MASMTRFESRTGRVSSKPEEIYGFVTDIRNFRQFVPEKMTEGLKVEKESCSFNLSPLGQVNVKLNEKDPFRKVVFTGSALKPDDFSLRLDIDEHHDGYTEIRITVDAELNPFFKMMVEKPVMQFLDTVIDEMEKFRGWKDAKS
jgi:carbon monoxide dehydrogenase subunit G